MLWWPFVRLECWWCGNVADAECVILGEQNKALPEKSLIVLLSVWPNLLLVGILFRERNFHTLPSSLSRVSFAVHSLANLSERRSWSARVSVFFRKRDSRELFAGFRYCRVVYSCGRVCCCCCVIIGIFGWCRVCVFGVRWCEGRACDCEGVWQVTLHKYRCAIYVSEFVRIDVWDWWWSVSVLIEEGQHCGRSKQIEHISAVKFVILWEKNPVGELRSRTVRSVVGLVILKKNKEKVRRCVWQRRVKGRE